MTKPPMSLIATPETLEVRQGASGMYPVKIVFETDLASMPATVHLYLQRWQIRAIMDGLERELDEADSREILTSDQAFGLRVQDLPVSGDSGSDRIRGDG